jgi:hypothetical protein
VVFKCTFERRFKVLCRGRGPCRGYSISITRPAGHDHGCVRGHGDDRHRASGGCVMSDWDVAGRYLRFACGSWPPCSRLTHVAAFSPSYFLFSLSTPLRSHHRNVYHRAHNLSGFRVVVGLLEDSQPRYAGHEKSLRIFLPPRLPPSARSVVA